jgi:hypothetical protein
MDHSIKPAGKIGHLEERMAQYAKIPDELGFNG